MKDNKIKRFCINIFMSTKSFIVTLLVIWFIIVVSTLLISTLSNSAMSEEEFTQLLLMKFSEINIVFLKVLIIAICFKLLMSVSRVKSLSSIDFFADEFLYRDIIYNNSVIGLSYVDDFKVDFYKNITITLLILQLKGRIEFDGNKIVVNNTSQFELRESEKWVLNNIKLGKIIIKDSNYFYSLAQKEAIEDGLLKDKEEVRKSLLIKQIKKFEVFLIFIIVFFCCNMIVKNSFPEFGEWFEDFLWIAVFFGGIILLIISCIKVIINSIHIDNSERTQKGEIINLKLEGLKNYIKNYSMLHEREKNEVLLWNEYLIYSVMFNQNKKIVDDIKKMMIFK